jgi:hypothetical protein
MTDKPIVIDAGRKDQVATRWNNRAGVGERPRLVAVEWRQKEKRQKAEKVEEPSRVSRGVVQGSLL